MSTRLAIVAGDWSRLPATSQFWGDATIEDDG
jgi:hypothetical protein